MPNKILLRLALVVAALLMVPLVAMQFSAEVRWGPGDFLVAGALLFGTGLAYELAARKVGALAYRCAAGLALAGALLVVWVNLAVGIIGSENHPANLMYVGVLAVGALGAGLAHFRPPGMARALFATALAQALLAGVALLVWKPLVTAPVLGVNVFLVLLFATSGGLFQHAARQTGHSDRATLA